MRQLSSFRIPSGIVRSDLRVLRLGWIAVLAGLLAGCVPAYEAQLENARARGDLEGAAELLARASERAPDDPALQREQGILAYQRGDYAAARDQLAKSLGQTPNDARTMLYAG